MQCRKVISEVGGEAAGGDEGESGLAPCLVVYCLLLLIFLV